MSDVEIAFEKVDYSDGERIFREFYSQKEEDKVIIAGTWEDFLKIPKVPGYVNNIKRVPNSFENIKDRKEEHMEFQPPIIESKSDDKVDANK